MLLRIVLVMTTAFTVFSVNAEEVDADDKQSFEMASNPDVLYRPWPVSSAIAQQDNVPPPPPGPYISSALSNLPAGFSNESMGSKNPQEGARPSPLLGPNSPWPVKGSQPKMWAPENEISYAPGKKSVPPMSKRPDIANRRPVPPRMYRRLNNPAYANHPSNFVPPQMNRQQRPPQMNHQQRPPQMNRQQRPPQMNHQQRPPQMNHQQRPPQMNRQQRPPQMNRQQRPPQMNQRPVNQPPIWNSFTIPMSNYPHQNQRSMQSAPR